MINYQDYDAIGLAELIRNGAVTPGEVLDEALEQLEKVNGSLNAVVLVQEAETRRRISEGLPDGPLRGVPFLLKDLYMAAVGYPSHNGSNLLRNTTYTRNSSMVDRLNAAGLVTFGRTTSPEGGIGVATEAAVYGGPTRNPWNLKHTSGGSSGGSGAAVAAGIVPAAHGSDGGGSVRIPASSCGLFGFKPTRARLPNGPFAGEGWAGMSISGFLTRSVRDTALLLDLTEGPDLGAPYVAPPLRDSYMAALEAAPAPLCIAYCDTTLTGEAIDPECVAAVKHTAGLLEAMGHHIIPARPAADTNGMMQAWTKIVACGTALGVNTVTQIRGQSLQEGEIEGLSRSAMTYAATISGAEYLASVAKVHAYGRELAEFFQDYDLLLTPTLAEPPAVVGRFSHDTDDYVAFRTGPKGVFAYSPYAAAFNASGQPAVSVPLYWSRQGLPIGVHLAAKFGEDELLMSVCAELERAQPWFNRRPAMS